ncbi:MAG TPA: hypothetical protein VGR41_05960 [Actinomycetota bacterium]|nr:hypothetical protein [Actinomycetota bacterium]
MSARLYGRSTGGSVAGVALVTGLVGSAASAMLWLHEVRPASGLTRFVTQSVLGTSDGWTALITVAAVAGGLGLLVAILGAIGSRRSSGGVVFAIVFSLIALTYPFAYVAQVVAKPFTGNGLLGA